jgi:hypothetical protein
MGLFMSFILGQSLSVKAEQNGELPMADSSKGITYVLTEEDGDYLGWQFGSSVFSANMHSLYTNTETLFSVPTLDLVEIIVDWIFGEK